MLESIYRLANNAVIAPIHLETIMGNLANAQMPGYKSKRLSVHSFTEELATAQDHELENYASLRAARTDWSQGALKPTGRTLDFALNGSGFFAVKTHDGKELLTRNGSFILDKEGVLVTREGYTVEGEGGELRFDIRDNLDLVRVRPDGSVYVRSAQGNRLVGKLKLLAPKENRLRRLGELYFEVSDPRRRVPKAEKVTVVNTFLEQANINPIGEMARMIEVTRNFQLTQNVLNKLSQLQSEHIKLNNG
ncbi:MAG: flagellar hook basal-body protein [Lentisphaerae bacterium]|nr:MAG: flagellar hook basal-body protein [Lentisphaerota bacterium]